MVQDRSFGARLFNLLNVIFLVLLAFASLFPLWHILMVSFSDRAATAGGFVTLWPIGFNLVSYEKVISSGAFLNGLRMSLMRTSLATIITLAVTVLTAYPLSRNNGVFRGRGFFVWLLIIGMLFSGGLIPLFLVVRGLNLLNNVWGLVLPFAVGTWNIIIMVNFFRDVPSELEDAANIDGANHFQMLWSLYLPLCTPALATIALFTAVWHWNEFFYGLIFINDSTNYPLQSYLRTVVMSSNMMDVIRDPTQFQSFSDRSVKAATIFVSTLPILVVYPFVQRYFVTGTRLGSIKG